MEITDIAPRIKLLDLQPPIVGYREFIGCYLLIGDEVAIIDPGPAVSIAGLLEGLRLSGIEQNSVNYIILTHVHIDHAGSVGDLAEIMPGAQVLAHPVAVPHLSDPARLWEASLKTLGDLALHYGRMAPLPAERITAVNDGMMLPLGRGLELRVLLTPGHAAHHLSIYEEYSRTLFAGEAAGACIRGALRPATPPPFRMEVSLASIDVLIARSPDRICYGHFGSYDGAVERLKRYRSKLQDWQHILGGLPPGGLPRGELLSFMFERDAELDYSSILGPDEVRREQTLLANSLAGLAGLMTPDSR